MNKTVKARGRGREKKQKDTDEWNEIECISERQNAAVERKNSMCLSDNLYVCTVIHEIKRKMFGVHCLNVVAIDILCIHWCMCACVRECVCVCVCGIAMFMQVCSMCELKNIDVETLKTSNSEIYEKTRRSLSELKRDIETEKNARNQIYDEQRNGS